MGVLGEADGSNLFTGLEILVDLRSFEPKDFPDDLPDDLVDDIALGTAGSVMSNFLVLYSEHVSSNPSWILIFISILVQANPIPTCP